MATTRIVVSGDDADTTSKLIDVIFAGLKAAGQRSIFVDHYRGEADAIVNEDFGKPDGDLVVVYWRRG
jgi:hypothetical protein